MPGLDAEATRDGTPAALLDAGRPRPSSITDGARREAMARAGRLLATRGRSEAELRSRLSDAGFDEAVVSAAMDRLRALGLVDDREFALQWVRERSTSKKLSSRALLHELTGKGIDREVAEEALAEAGLDETAQAIELASRYLRRVASKPLREQASRIHQMLSRRGYAAETCEAALKAVLPPEGWD